MDLFSSGVQFRRSVDVRVVHLGVRLIPAQHALVEVVLLFKVVVNLILRERKFLEAWHRHKRLLEGGCLRLSLLGLLGQTRGKGLFRVNLFIALLEHEAHHVDGQVILVGLTFLRLWQLRSLGCFLRLLLWLFRLRCIELLALFVDTRRPQVRRAIVFGRLRFRLGFLLGFLLGFWLFLALGF